MFSRCGPQPEVRGGKTKKLRRNESLRGRLFDRLKRWNEGKIDVWSESCKLYSRRETRQSTASLAANIRRATECAQDARYGKAVAALLSVGTCPVTEVSEMKAKHLPLPLPSYQKVRRQSLFGSNLNGCARRWMVSPLVLLQGPLGLPQDILGCTNRAVSEAALDALTKLGNHMVAGLAPRELAPFIAGAPLMALNKSGGGLRPIAIGETIRRLVSKCCCEATPRMPRLSSAHCR